MEELLNSLNYSYDLIANNPWRSAFITLLTSGIAGTGVFSFLRRLKPSEDKEEIGEYFTDRRLLSPPSQRPAYSDRMAYVLAEMSDLAYYQFEGAGGLLRDTVSHLKNLDISKLDIQQFLEKFSLELMGNRTVSTDFLSSLLKVSGYELLSTFNIVETQGFACKRIAPNEPPYVVIAFRGTEQKISDWLTDSRAVPKEIDRTKVHGGFFRAFTEAQGKDGKTVSETIDAIMKSQAVKDGQGKTLPLFITGHSLGGALALLTTKMLADDINGACYTFGAPRVANYEYFKEVKTPIYRVVNSADVVPRLPPGALMPVWVGAAKLLSWVTGFMPPVSQLFVKLEALLDQLNGYRHFGDLRYLTDIATGKFDQVNLLRNPPAIDRVLWIWKHLTISLFIPIKHHSMKIYRKKLAYIANDRA